MDDLTHFDSGGNAIMVDVGGKQISDRSAQASGNIYVNAAIYDVISCGTAAKGDVLGVARIAGIMAVKNTPQLIPLAHPILINRCALDFILHKKSGEDENQWITAVCTVSTAGLTGVEMEALTGVTAALLTIYDMCKALGKDMKISDVHLLSKTGGKNGDYCIETFAAQTEKPE